jgi:hypothetical protein
MIEIDDSWSVADRSEITRICKILQGVTLKNCESVELSGQPFGARLFLRTERVGYDCQVTYGTQRSYAFGVKVFPGDEQTLLVYHGSMESMGADGTQSICCV